MTDRIDLDELAGTDEEEPETGNRGDWLWRGDEAGDEEAPAPEEASTAGADPDTDEPATDPGTDAANTANAADAADTASGARSSSDDGPDAVPHVPRSNRDRPAGVPESSGGAGAGSSPRERSGDGGDGGAAAERAERDTLGETGPHGGGVDDMTMALTYRAARRLADPAAAVADASSWADWIGIVGAVPAHVINKFQREHVIDADFFNGSGTAPGERLAEIGPHSMFYAERMVLVGVPGEDGPVAERADWEFVPLPEAAEGAGWALRDPDGE